jgi:hypothetical protein
MQDEQPSFLRDNQALLEVALSIDPKILEHFRLLEQPFGAARIFATSTLLTKSKKS